MRTELNNQLQPPLSMHQFMSFPNFSNIIAHSSQHFVVSMYLRECVVPPSLCLNYFIKTRSSSSIDLLSETRIHLSLWLNNFLSYDVWLYLLYVLTDQWTLHSLVLNVILIQPQIT